jgi:hypothetical protein
MKVINMNPKLTILCYCEHTHTHTFIYTPARRLYRQTFTHTPPPHACSVSQVFLSIAHNLQEWPTKSACFTSLPGSPERMHKITITYKPDASATSTCSKAGFFQQPWKRKDFSIFDQQPYKRRCQKTRDGGRGRQSRFFQKSRPAFRAGSLINIDTIYQAGKADCQKAGKKPAFPAPA